jgi:hypothetical protein
MRLQYLGVTFLLLSTHLLGQEAKFIDLTMTAQRVDFRSPPAPPIEDGVGGGYGGVSIGDCGVGAQDPRSLTVSLQSVIVRNKDPKRPFEIEFKVLNTGKVSLQLPIGIHLSDLQPNDASAVFTYMSLALSVSPIEDVRSTAFVQLYGTADTPNTLITLNPGEWLRVEANVRFDVRLPPAGIINLEPGYWLHRATFHPHPGGYSTDIANICLNHVTPTPTMRVQRD